MNELVFKSDKGNPVTNSLLVAEKFGRRHSDVIKAIEQHIEDLKSTDEKIRWFIESTYCDGKGEYRKMYVMNRDGFSLLVMSFNNTKDVLRFKIDFIEAFNKMEKAIKESGLYQFEIPHSFADALRLAAEQQEKIERQNAQLQEQAPKVLFASAVETSNKSCLIGELAKILKQNGIEMGQKRLFEWMRKNGYLCKTGESYNQPTQMAMEMSLFEIKKSTINNPNGTTLVTSTTKVTGKGQVYFVNKFLREKVF